MLTTYLLDNGDLRAVVAWVRRVAKRSKRLFDVVCG
jgi:hypothetical protein